MRLNPAGVRAGSYNSLLLTATPASPGACASACTPEQIAGYDFFNWRNGISAMLGGDAQGGVTVEGGVSTITVNWREKTLGLNDTSTQVYSLDVRP
jgi:hypothetical protein